MEPLVAVSFAANILQFVDYACHIFDIGSQIRRHGVSNLELDMEQSAKSLEHQIARIRSSRGATIGLRDADQALDRLATECLDVAKELTDFIDKFRLDQKLDVARKEVKTLAKAIKLKWNKPRIEELARRLDRVRSQLYSEVILNIQGSIKEIIEKADHSTALLEQLSESQVMYQAELTRTRKNERLSIESHSKQLSYIDDAAEKRQERVIQAINSFAEVLQTKVIFPALPKSLTDVDPSLSPAALQKYDVIEDTVLQSLHFPNIDSREAQIHDAYGETCSWIFEDPEENRKPWSNFRQWLEEGKGCYWIEGKAGCGKSTLMKFLHSDDRTYSALRKWAESDELIVASCFFWMAGTPLQKNQEGLLRTLLYTILDKRRSLISRVLPRRYDATVTKILMNNSNPMILFPCESPGCSSSFDNPGLLEAHHRDRHKIDDSTRGEDVYGRFALEELKKALSKLAHQNMGGLKICLIVDGLDEYVGNQLEMIEFFKLVTSQCSIKAVVSSRPEPSFVEAFIHSPTLRVEDLTAGDIKKYIESKLLSHSTMRGHIYQDSKLPRRLTDSITSRACGVFLWVFLVIGTLLEHLSDGCYSADLERIVEMCPPELHELYEHMFKRMKPSHRLEAFTLFQAIHQAQGIEQRIPSALRLSFMEKDDPKGAIKSPIRLMTPEDMRERILNFTARLRSRCCGLFEVQYHEQFKPETHWKGKEGRVTHLHRTVSDFLRDPGVRQVIDRETSSIDAVISERLLASILYYFKSWRFFHVKRPAEWKKYIAETKAFLVYCQRCEANIGTRQIDYIEEFDRSLIQLWQSRNLETGSKTRGNSLGNCDVHWAETALVELHLKLTPDPDVDPLLSFAARYGVRAYTYHKLKARAPHSTDAHNRLLVARLCFWAMYDADIGKSHIAIIQELLEGGFDVSVQCSRSGRVGSGNSWDDLLQLQPHNFPDQFLRRLASLKKADILKSGKEKYNIKSFNMWTKLIELYISHGANLDVETRAPKEATGKKSGRKMILDVLEDFQMALGLSAEESATITERKRHVEALLAGIPVDTSRLEIEGSNSQTHTATNTTYVEEKSLQQISTSRETLEPFSLSINPTTYSSLHCQRCKVVDALREVSFEPNVIFEAIEKAGVGHDVTALTSWILHTNEKPKTRGETRTEDKRLKQSSKTTELRAVGHSNPMAKKWSVVAGAPPPKKYGEDVDSQRGIKPKKPRHRRTKKANANGGESIRVGESNSSGGAFNLTSGTFTWSLEPKDPSQKALTLSTEQTERLQQMLEDMLAQK